MPRKKKKKKKERKLICYVEQRIFHYEISLSRFFCNRENGIDSVSIDFERSFFFLNRGMGGYDNG